MEFDRENPAPLARYPGAEAHWHDWSPELETAYLQQLAGVENLEDATSLQLVVNTAAGGSIAHLGISLQNLQELNLNGSTLDSLRDLGTGFRMLQVLWVSRCGLKSLDGLNGLPTLRELYAAYNDVADLQPVDSCSQLEILDVECNCIPDPDAVLYLTSCTHLQALTLAGNPAATQPGYRRSVCSTLPSLHTLDDEPVTSADRVTPGASPASSASSLPQHSHQTHNHRPDGTSRSGPGEALPPPPLKAAAASAAAAADTSPASSLPTGCLATGGWMAGSDGGGSGGVVAQSGGSGGARGQQQPDAEEVAFVVAGIKHARVGVDSHEFREIEMNLLVATADGTDVQLDVRPGTSTLLPASAGTWVRTLRSSREGSLAALRANHMAAAAAASSTARTGSHSPSSPCSASPLSSRPPSSQQQRTSAMSASLPPQERWAMPTAAGVTLGLSSSFGAPATSSHPGTGPVAGGRRPSSGTGIGVVSGGGAAVDSPMRPGSGGCRPGTGRPFSARPGTAASFSARIGTSASTGAAPASANAGLYWAKNRISGGSGGTSGTSAADSGAGAGGGGSSGGAARAAVLDSDGVASSSKLTQGSDTTFGGSFARDLRKWKGAAVRASASVSSGGAAPGVANGTAGAAAGAVTVLGGGNGLSQTLLRGGQLDTRALLEELKRWKLETADKVLFMDPDETASAEMGWAGADGPDPTGALGAAMLSNGGSGGGGSHRADVLCLSGSQDGTGPEAASLGLAFGLGLALIEQGPELAYSPAIPGSPLQPARPPAGVAAAGRRKMVLAKVLRDIAADSIGSGPSISDILAGLRPVHAPSAYEGGGAVGGHHTPGVAWGAPVESAGGKSVGSMVFGNSGLRSSGASTHQQQQSGQRPGSARSVCSSSGQSDYGPSVVVGASSSRPGSRDEPTDAGSGGGGGSALQRQKSGTRAPGLPVGPSAPSYRVASAAGEVDVRSSNPIPAVRVSDW